MGRSKQKTSGYLTKESWKDIMQPLAERLVAPSEEHVELKNENKELNQRVLELPRAFREVYQYQGDLEGQFQHTFNTVDQDFLIKLVGSYSRPAYKLWVAALHRPPSPASSSQRSTQNQSQQC